MVLKHRIKDEVATVEMPDHLRKQAALFTGCIVGAETVERIRNLLHEAGFTEVKIELNAHSKELVSGCFPGSGAEYDVASADIEAHRPSQL